jgi:superfamily II DNA or RNA helicase
MNLDDVSKKIYDEYRSDVNEIHSDFYVPCLANSINYDRAVGYFTSDSLRLVARGLVSFVRNQNSLMRLIASPVLNDTDAQALGGLSSDDARKMISRLIETSFTDAVRHAQGRHLEFLSWMISEGRLQVKLAYRPKHVGIFHEKIGIFTDDKGNRLAFSGSMNETYAGMVSNFESFDVFKQPMDASRILSKQKHFDSLWACEHKDLTVIDFTNASAELLKKYRSSSYKPPIEESELFGVPAGPVAVGKVTVPTYIGKLSSPPLRSPRDYQNKAIQAWNSNGNTGVMEMATGTGKTVTALFALELLQKTHPKMVIVILAPYKHLCNQWGREVEGFGLKPVLCYDSSIRWLELLESQLEALDSCQQGTLVVCATNATFSQNSEFLSILRGCQSTKCIVGDEVHNLGSSQAKKILPKEFSVRLGLSATPERSGDDEGTDAIFDYFGKTVFEYNLEKAMKNGFLTPYEFDFSIVEMTELEAKDYAEMTKKYARLANSNDPKEKEMAELILFQRSNLVGAAFNKIKVLIDRLTQDPLRRGLVYCSPGEVTDGSGAVLGPQKDLVSAAFAQCNPPIRARQFVHETDDDERELMVKEISDDSIQGLIAIKCLDEGVDVPCLEQAYILASSKNYRQTVQRRGRLLRNSPGKLKAKLVDFILVPPGWVRGRPCEPWEVSLINGEIKRAEEFAMLASNREEVLIKINELK